jgi:RNA polymerase sigma-70 factor, ECF subfamily
MNDVSRPNADQIVQLLTNVQQQLTRYVRTLVPNRTDADEVLQDVNLYVWRHADEFLPGTNFTAWARKIAYYQVLTYRKGKSRDRLYFSDALIEQLAENTDRRKDDDDAELLKECVAKLEDEDRVLIDLRYEPGATTESVARHIGRSVKAVYNSMTRIRKQLLDCLERAMVRRRRS